MHRAPIFQSQHDINDDDYLGLLGLERLGLGDTFSDSDWSPGNRSEYDSDDFGGLSEDSLDVEEARASKVAIITEQKEPDCKGQDRMGSRVSFRDMPTNSRPPKKLGGHPSAIQKILNGSDYAQNSVPGLWHWYRIFSTKPRKQNGSVRLANHC